MIAAWIYGLGALEYFAGFVWDRKVLRWSAAGTLALGCLTQAFLSYRNGHSFLHPLNLASAVSLVAWLLIPWFLVLEWRAGFRWAGPLVAVCAFAFALIVAYSSPARGEALGILKSRWGAVHGIAGALGYAGLLIAGFAGVLQFVQEKGKREVLLVAASLMAVLLLPMAGGEHFFSLMNLDFYRVAKDANGADVLLQFKLGSGEMVTEYVTLPQGAWLLAIAIAGFAAHWLLGSLAVLAFPESAHKPKRSWQGTVRKIYFNTAYGAYAVGLLATFALIGWMTWSSGRLPGFKLMSNPYRFLNLWVVASVGILAACFAAWGERIQKVLPSPATLERINDRSLLLGFAFLTLAIASGSAWAYLSWGRLWGWDPKEIWTLLVWLFYAIGVILRMETGWEARKAALFSIAGIFIVLFSLFGANLLLSGQHSFG